MSGASDQTGWASSRLCPECWEQEFGENEARSQREAKGATQPTIPQTAHACVSMVSDVDVFRIPVTQTWPSLVGNEAVITPDDPVVAPPPSAFFPCGHGTDRSELTPGGNPTLPLVTIS